jgi:TolB protein
MNADGSNVRNLTNLPESDEDTPAWSSDGNRIVFESDSFGNSEIFIMNADGSDKMNLTRDIALDRHPVFSPN